MKHKKWNETNLHHIVGLKYRHTFNVNIPENKIIVNVAKHEALNCLVGDKQSPREQLEVLYNERWINVLSEETKKKITAILEMPDDRFYIDDVLGT